MDFPARQPSLVLPQFVHTLSAQCPAYSQLANEGMTGNTAAITWVANLAVFVPMVLPWPYPVRRLWWTPGSTITTSNADMGIYNKDGTRLISTGSTALAGSQQYVDVTDFWLPEGNYYFAWTCDNTTNRANGFTSATALMLREAGVLQQASVAPGSLPATMASAVAATQALYQMFGITRTASGF